MRKFSSYGPLNIKTNYYAPRKKLITNALLQLLGETPDEGGHYITVWAPRQTGKTWVMQQVLWRLQQEKQYERFDAIKVNVQHLKTQHDVNKLAASLTQEIVKKLGIKPTDVKTLEDFHLVFTNDVLKKPLILILDEFDALVEEAISGIAGVLRNIYITRQDQADKTTEEKEYLLHGVALIGVRSVLGIENVTGSPFNVQRSLHIPNLTFEEADGMFKWYERESRQHVEQEVIEQLYYETNGQPGLTCWLGELLSEGFEWYTVNKEQPITINNFKEVYAAAINVLPNNNILNIISKAKQDPYKHFILELFQTHEKIPFKYDNQHISFLYMNGVIDMERTETAGHFVKFACPFVQKRVFNYFSDDLFGYMGQLHEPFEDLSSIITEDSINIRNLLKRYERYLKQNRDWLLKDAPKRADLRIYEAVYHFNLYMYLHQFLKRRKGDIYPEFPTGNGKIDLIIKYRDKLYGLEVKSFTDDSGYQEALIQAAQYGKQLNLSDISLVCFVEYIDDENRSTYETAHIDEETGVNVSPIFLETGR